jgi:methionyl aminopeptidase
MPKPLGDKYTAKEYDDLRKSGKILGGCLEMIKKHVVAGATTLELDALCEKYMTQRGAEPNFKNYQGYKHSICASVNNESVHGIPRKDKILKNGDIISIDCGARLGGMNTDMARTYAVGEITAQAQEIIDVTKQAFYAGIEGLCAGTAVKEIGKKIEQFIDGRFGIVKIYFGHGIGKSIHENPLIPNFDIDKHTTSKTVMDMSNYVLCEGDIICVEPMINVGTGDLMVGKDGWTAVTRDGELAAHYENTILILRDGVEIITPCQY